MISLFLDTASYNIIVGIYKNTEKLALNIQKNDNHLSERIITVLDQTLNQARIDINDIDNIFVVNGPGSFTGIRIGVTVAKTLAWSVNKKIYPVSELEVLTSGLDKKSASLIDARRGYVYAGLYDDCGKNLIEDSYILLENFIKKCEKYKDVSFVSYDDIEYDNITSPKINIEKIIKNHLNDESINPHSLNPNYLKLTEAEEKLNDKKNN